MNRSEIILQYTRINRQFEALYAPKIRRALHVTVTAVIDNLREGGYDQATRSLRKGIGNQRLATVIEDLYINVGLRHARLTHRRLVSDQKKGFGFNASWTKFIIDYLKQFLLDKITFRVHETTRNALLKILTAGTIHGLGIDGMIAQLKDWPFERYQAARIVRTEINRAANVGAKAQESTSEYEQQKEWISVVDNRTRGRFPEDHANHVGLNGTVIDANDLFTDPRNGDKLDIPGDPNASAGSTINCRCNAAYVNKRDNNGELIPKRKTTSVIYPGQVYRGQTITI